MELVEPLHEALRLPNVATCARIHQEQHHNFLMLSFARKASVGVPPMSLLAGFATSLFSL
jgi:hypothetical protein